MIANNLIDNASYSISENDLYEHYPIVISGLKGSSLDEDHLLYNDITITGNTVKNNRSSHALYIRSARDLYIRNNDFGETTSDSWLKTSPSIYFDYVLNVELSGNKYATNILGASQKYDGTEYENVYGSDT